jgi:hypothetical protein
MTTFQGVLICAGVYMLIVILLAIILLVIPDSNRPVDEIQFLELNCKCKLPEESCVYCRRLAEILHRDEELPYHA